MKKTLRNILGIGLPVLLFVGACKKDKISYHNQYQINQVEETKDIYRFDKFGEIKIPYDIEEIKIADMDGDGDMDILLHNRSLGKAYEQIIIYENKIPQNNKK